MTKPLRETRKIELVETHNIALNLDRMGQSYGDLHWRRALYHALGMSVVSSRSMLEKVRIALELP